MSTIKEDVLKDKMDKLRISSFIAPDGSNRKEVEENMHLIISDLLDKLCNSENRPLLPDSLAYEFNDDILQKNPKTLSQIRQDIGGLIDHSMNPYHPKYIGHMDSMPTLFSIIGDMLASALNNNMFSLEMAPFLTQLEYKLVKEFCSLFGLPANAGGMVLGGGSLANLQALTVARNYVLGGNSISLNKAENDLVIFCSEDAHVSIQKSAMILGIGIQNVIKIDTDSDGKMKPLNLIAAIQASISKGQKPIAIVATAGTTITGNIDPIREIVTIAKDCGIWLHVDAIWGGGLVFSHRKKELLNGIEGADSITFNPQKWMTIAKTCSLVMFRDNDLLENFFRIRKTYVKEHDILTDLSEVGITGTKRAEVLKLWLSLQNIGTEGYSTYVDYTLQLTQHFIESAKKRSYLNLATDPDTSVICMRGEPSYLDEKDFDKWNEGLQEYMLHKGEAFFSLPTFRGGLWQRIILLNPYLTIQKIDEVFQSIDQYEINYLRKQTPND